MATTPRITTYSTKITASNTAWASGTKVTLPFRASRVWIAAIASTGSGDLELSLDGGTTVSATMHHQTGAEVFEWQLQEPLEIHYRVNSAATSVTFILNAEIKAWPTTVG